MRHVIKKPNDKANKIKKLEKNKIKIKIEQNLIKKNESKSSLLDWS